MRPEMCVCVGGARSYLWVRACTHVLPLWGAQQVMGSDGASHHPPLASPPPLPSSHLGRRSSPCATLCSSCRRRWRTVDEDEDEMQRDQGEVSGVRGLRSGCCCPVPAARQLQSLLFSTPPPVPAPFPLSLGSLVPTSPVTQGRCAVTAPPLSPSPHLGQLGPHQPSHAGAGVHSDANDHGLAIVRHLDLHASCVKSECEFGGWTKATSLWPS